jgi:hypothetical protein
MIATGIPVSTGNPVCEENRLFLLFVSPVAKSDPRGIYPFNNSAADHDG